ncbi:Disease resistance protein (CC-NBS-LRR class) family [Rhynchospora pubera]|uniref:Disease resistance protein (CC-NBS-LRR class) family n=1 Tax=Rhynchospora pubera TaxID=906938 RepID=A0AAV8EPU2_9POAL|nr:Disease resistance protein (CC-NBS-LRR class) family [Rhynchospora pubera]
MGPYELRLLNDEDSRDLLIKKAFPYKKYGDKFPDDLHELVDALSKKCKGLPLALIVLGGILSTKDHIYSAWEKVLRTMEWHSDGKDCINILGMSYDDMPCYLKTCFLYLALFPEDYEISARRLIKMWIAEGFMPQQGRKMMEEIAEDYLDQLFQRSMVQVSKRHVNGSIKYCRVHDLLRDFAMHQAGKENFITVFTNPQNNNHCGRATRRASLQSCGPQFKEYVGLKTRSLFLFGLKHTLPKHSVFRLLRVLLIEAMRIVDLKGIDRLIHLKYLGVRCCETLKVSECSLGHLKNLETLHIRDTFEISILPDLWTINTLRHVLCNVGFLPEVPWTADLPNLQSLDCNWSKSVTLKASLFPPHLIKLTLMDSKLGQDPMPELGKLNNLKKLRLLGDLYNEKQIICPAGFPVLQSLVLSVKTVEVLTVEKGVMPKLKNLSKSYDIKLEIPPELMHLI